MGEIISPDLEEFGLKDIENKESKEKAIDNEEEARQEFCDF